MYNNRHTQHGFLKYIVIAVIALIAASYFFDFSVQEAVEDEQTQENFGYLSDQSQSFWDEHLAEPAQYLWNEVFLNTIWSAFTSNMERLQNGEPTDFEALAPGIVVPNTDQLNAGIGNIVNNAVGTSIQEAIEQSDSIDQ